MTTPHDPGRPAAPSSREIADLTSRLRELSTHGSEVDPGERARFLADKQELLDRIADAEHRGMHTHRPGESAVTPSSPRGPAAESRPAAGLFHVHVKTELGHDDSVAVRAVSARAAEAAAVAQHPTAAVVVDVYPGDEDAVAIEDADNAHAGWFTHRGEAGDETDGRGAATAARGERDAGPEVIGLACPECEEEVIDRSPVDLVPFEGHGMERPGYSHLDGEPLCPVMGPHGYRPADPVEVHADFDDRDDDYRAADPDDDRHDPAGSTAEGAVAHAHEAVAAALSAPSGPDQPGEARGADEAQRAAQIADWHAQDQGHDDGADAGDVRER